MNKNNKKLLSLAVALALLAHAPSISAEQDNTAIDLSALKSASVAADADAQLEKIFDGVREFHIFKQMYNRWSTTDTYTTLVTGQNGFPVFSARSDKDPKYTDYPIDYKNQMLKRYQPVRPPASVAQYYSDRQISLGDKDTATYKAPLVAAGTIGKGRVLLMGSHLYGSILVNPRNYSTNYSNGNKTDTPDSADMENFFHNVFAWLTEQNETPENHYAKTGNAINILSNKKRTMFWHTGGATYQQDSEAFNIHNNFNLASGERPYLVPTWKEAAAQGLLDPEKYPLLILEDFRRVSSWTNYYKSTKRKTQLDEVELIVDYVRAGGGVLIMDSPSFAAEEGIQATAANEIAKKAGITTFFQNRHQKAKLLPKKTDVGGVHQYDMCLVDYIGYTDLQRRLELDDYSNVPTTLNGLKTALENNGKINYLEELLGRRERKIFVEGDAQTPLTQADCGTVEVELSDGTTSAIQTTLVAGDGIIQDGGNHDKFAKYPVDLNFTQAQGDVGGSMNTLLAHELGEKTLSKVDLNREYTNMGALLLNDAVFTGEKFNSLNDLLAHYKVGGDFVNTQGEFYPGFSFATGDVLDYRKKPVTRIMLERAFYDETLKYDPSQYPGQTSSVVSTEAATIYLRRNTDYQKWYTGNMQSTGLYAPAHEEVSVTLPDNVDPAKMQLIISVGDNVAGLYRHEINLKRPPKTVKKYKFLSDNGSPSRTITVKHPYGGLLFLKSFDSTAASDAQATVTFAGVQKSVRFVLGETTESEWTAIKNHIAPKAELESKHYIVTVPRANMASLSFAEARAIAENFDLMAENAYDFYGYDQYCTEPFNEHTPPSCEAKKAHKNREVFDPHISIGAGHSGYPIMVMNWKPNKTSFPQDATNSFLLWHEMGHNMVESWLGIPGATEVANNVMAMHQQKRFGQSLRTASSITNVGIILAKGQPWADGGNSGRLLMFHQLAKWIDTNYLAEFKAKNTKYYNVDGSVNTTYPFLDGDGFDIFKILHREARDKAVTSDKYDVCMKQTSATKTDMLAICTSTILDLDTTDFFKAWKAGVVGIGNVGGENIYDATGGMTEGLRVDQLNKPEPAIENYS